MIRYTRSIWIGILLIALASPGIACEEEPLPSPDEIKVLIESTTKVLPLSVLPDLSARSKYLAVSDE